jgi:hypothetical protein
VTSTKLHNLNNRLKIIHWIGLNFSSNTDFETLVKMKELLGGSVPSSVIDDLKSIKNKIQRDKEHRESLIT